MKHGFAIIGCGMISRFHARAIQELPQAFLAGCYSRRREASEAFGQEFGCPVFGTLQELLARPEVTIVTICTPSGAHLEPARECAQAGKQILVEKPLEVTRERCAELIAICKQHNVRLGTIFPARYHENAWLVKRAIDSGRFGKLVLGTAEVNWYRTQEYYDQGNWRGTWKLDGGGALMNQAIHSVDLLQWLMGPVDSVVAQTATLAHERIEVEDVAVAALRFRSQALGCLQATTGSYPGFLKRLTVHGDGGSVILEEDVIRHWVFRDSSPEDERILKSLDKSAGSGGGASDPAAISHAPHRRLFADFLHAIDSQTGFDLDGLEGKKSVDLIRAIYESAQSGTCVSLR